MANVNPENDKDLPHDPASSQGTPAPSGRPGEESVSGGLEKTLEQTQTRLRELEQKLGDDKGMNTVKDPPVVASKQPPSGDSVSGTNIRDIDQTLAALEQDLVQLTQEVTQDTASTSAATVEKPSAAPSNQSSVDDLLADLSDELNSVTNPVEDQSAAENNPAHSAPASAAASPEPEKTLSPPVQEIIEHVPGESGSPSIPEASAEALPVEAKEKDVRSIIDHFPDVEAASEPETPVEEPPAVAAAAPQPSKPADDPFAAFAKAKDGKLKNKPATSSKTIENSEDEQVVMNELDQAEKDLDPHTSSTPAVPPSSGTSAAPVMLPVQNPYTGFSVPEKVLIYGLQAANKPFSFVGANTRDKIGVVAVITLIVVMLAAGLLLYFR